jgi:hypothetical protein
MTALHPLAKGVQHPAPLRRNIPAWSVLAGLFAAPLAWSLQLLVSYGLNGDACSEGGIVAHTSTLKFGVLLSGGILAILLCCAGLLAAFRTWRLTRDEGPGDHHEGLTAGAGRTRFLGLCGMIAGSIFLIASLCELLVPFLVSPCIQPLF